MRINAGCGKRYIEGMINVDVQWNPRNPKPDIIADVKSIPLPDGCADEILAVHLFEHFHLWEASDVLVEWRRLLKTGGLLILELPNLYKCAKNYIARYEGREPPPAGKDPNQLDRWGIYGDPRYKDPWMCHRWGWDPEDLTAFLEKHGFGASRELPTQWHPVGQRYRDMRIEARKL